MSETPFSLAVHRPEYFGTVDALLSDLAWQALLQTQAGEVGDVSACEKLVFELAPGVLPGQLISRKNNQARGYLVRSEGSTPSLELHLSRTVGGAIGQTLDARAGKALADALRATRPAKSDLFPASAAVWPGLFLQGLAGTLRREGPPNYLAIVNSLYMWGATGGEARTFEGPRRILKAVLSVPGQDPTQVLGDAVATAICEWAKSEAEPVGLLQHLGLYRKSLLQWSEGAGPLEEDTAPMAFQSLERTPFLWFKQAIDRLTADPWRQGLPAARWNDWLACVLRTGIGFGFLYEMRYYRRLAQELVADDSAIDSWQRLRVGMIQPTLTWYPASATASERDVAPRIRQWCGTGDAVRKWLREVSVEIDVESVFSGDAATNGPKALEAFRSALDENSATTDWRDNLRSLLSTKAASNNAEETVRYSLINRERHTLGADLYSVLMPRGRLVVVEPAEEWLVVVAALCSATPEMSATLRQLRSTLAVLGIDASRQVIVDELERAGLARSAHDADDALEINPVF